MEVSLYATGVCVCVCVYVCMVIVKCINVEVKLLLSMYKKDIDEIFTEVSAIFLIPKISICCQRK
jgi:hypothetical protein